MLHDKFDLQLQIFDRVKPRCWPWKKGSSNRRQTRCSVVTPFRENRRICSSRWTCRFRGLSFYFTRLFYFFYYFYSFGLNCRAKCACVYHAPTDHARRFRARKEHAEKGCLKWRGGRDQSAGGGAKRWVLGFGNENVHDVDKMTLKLTNLPIVVRVISLDRLKFMGFWVLMVSRCQWLYHASQKNKVWGMQK